jgi:hypothetical protein
MRTAIADAPEFYTAFDPGCGRITPVIAYETSTVLAGNFRDDSGGCYVWLNLNHAPLLDAQEICKLTLHELGHLTGLQHSQDPDDVMYTPFRASPVPRGCTSPLAGDEAARRSGA